MSKTFYMQGQEEFFYSDSAQVNYDNLANSVIVTGCSPWTAYQYDNYQVNKRTRSTSCKSTRDSTGGLIYSPPWSFSLPL